MAMTRASHSSARPLHCSTNSSLLVVASVSRSPVAHLASRNLANRLTRNSSTLSVMAAASCSSSRSDSRRPGQYFRLR